MWDAGPDYTRLIDGAHDINTTASAWYAGRLTAELEVDPVGAARHDIFDGQDIRRTIDGLTIIDRRGNLTPRRISDPLAPFGQRIVIRQQISAARGAVQADFPLGEFLITNPEPTSGWRKYHDTHLPTGGTVTLTGLDRWEIVQRSPLVGLWQAPAGATVRSEVRRLMRGIMPVVDAAIPNTSIPASKAVHPEQADEAIRGLLELVGRVPHVDRMGRFAPRPLTTTTGVWKLTVNEQTDIGALPRLTDEDIYNRVVTTGESDDMDQEIMAIVNETGRLAPGPEFGWRTYTHHSPLYKTNTQARTGGNTILRNKARERTILYSVRTRFDPCRDVLDPVDLEVIPNNPLHAPTTHRGIVISLRHDLTGGEMDVEVAVPWTEAGTHA